MFYPIHTIRLDWFLPFLKCIHEFSMLFFLLFYRRYSSSFFFLAKNHRVLFFSRILLVEFSSFYDKKNQIIENSFPNNVHLFFILFFIENQRFISFSRILLLIFSKIPNLPLSFFMLKLHSLKILL